MNSIPGFISMSTQYLQQHHCPSSTFITISTFQYPHAPPNPTLFCTLFLSIIIPIPATEWQVVRMNFQVKHTRAGNALQKWWGSGFTHSSEQSSREIWGYAPPGLSNSRRMILRPSDSSFEAFFFILYGILKCIHIWKMRGSSYLCPPSFSVYDTLTSNL